MRILVFCALVTTGIVLSSASCGPAFGNLFGSSGSSTGAGAPDGGAGAGGGSGGAHDDAGRGGAGGGSPTCDPRCATLKDSGACLAPCSPESLDCCEVDGGGSTVASASSSSGAGAGGVGGGSSSTGPGTGGGSGGGPPVLVLTQCATDGAAPCSAGFDEYTKIGTPKACGGGGCAVGDTAGIAYVCYATGVHEVRAACDLATACAGGLMLATTIPTCDCAGGDLFVCTSQ